jgi:hypothetical protein
MTLYRRKGLRVNVTENTKLSVSKFLPYKEVITASTACLPRNALSLTRTSRQVRQESLEVFFKANTVHYNLPVLDFGARQEKVVEKFVKVFEGRLLKSSFWSQLRSLHLHLGAVHWYAVFLRRNEAPEAWINGWRKTVRPIVALAFRGVNIRVNFRASLAMSGGRGHHFSIPIEKRAEAVAALQRGWDALRRRSGNYKIKEDVYEFADLEIKKWINEVFDGVETPNTELSTDR